MTFSARSFGESQFVAQAPVLLGSGAARPRALDRARLDQAVRNAQEALRRGAGEDEVAQVEVAGERSGVALAQPAIQLQRRDRRGMQQPLREVDLEAVAGVDVLDRAPHRCQVAGPVEKLLETPGSDGHWMSAGRTVAPV